MRKGRVAVDIRFDGERRLLELTNSVDGPRIAYFTDEEAERIPFIAEFGAGGLATASGLVSGYLSELEARRSVDEDA